MDKMWQSWHPALLRHRTTAMKYRTNSGSRRRTPWTHEEAVSPLQAFIDSTNASDYERRHPALVSTGEVEMLNSFEVSSCRRCGSVDIHRYGRTGNGIARCRWSSSELKGVPDKENPLDPVNEVCAMLKRFPRSHSGFTRGDLQDCLNLFCFTVNPPHDRFLKVEAFIKRALDFPVLCRYRDKISNS